MVNVKKIGSCLSQFIVPKDDKYLYVKNNARSKLWLFGRVPRYQTESSLFNYVINRNISKKITK